MCLKCKVAVDRKNRDLEIHRLPPLLFPLSQEEVAELLPEIMKRIAVNPPILLQPPLPAHPPLVHCQGTKASVKTIVPAPLHSKKANNTTGS